MVHVTLPDGSVKEVEAGATPFQIAESISPRLASAALVAELDGKLVDLTEPITADAKLRLLTERDEEALQVYRHSSAHLLAAAVLELFPETKLGVGPPTDTGFFYDMQRDEPFTPEDLEKIEQQMQKIVDRDEPNRRVWMDRDEALKLYQEQGDTMKCELISEKTDDPKVSIYKTGDKFNDFCRGPHIPSMGRIKAFQADVGCGLLLEGRRAQRPVATRLRHIVLLEEGSRKIPQSA